MDWVVYIIETSNGKLYTGITNNLEKRFNQHKSQKKGAKFFYFSEAKNILLKEGHPNRSEASKREASIKKMTRQEKLELIAKANS